MRREVRLFLVKIDCKNLETHGRAPLNIEQEIEHRIAILATGQTNHYSVPVLDHSKLLYRLAHSAQQPGLYFTLNQHSKLHNPKYNPKDGMPCRKLTTRQCHLNNTLSQLKGRFFVKGRS